MTTRRRGLINVSRCWNVLPDGQRTAPIYKIYDMYINCMHTACVPHPNMGTLISHHRLHPFALRPAIEQHQLVVSCPYINAQYVEYCVEPLYNDIRITLYTSTKCAQFAHMRATHTNIEILRYLLYMYRIIETTMSVYVWAPLFS